ncbi:MAG: asparagine--tRNA ligase [Ardenticatenales bacterium]|nr:asparagine--tRNA ligase [Ardenticatenales bacterium]
MSDPKPAPVTTTIAAAGAHVGMNVRVQGWVSNRTDKGKLQFIALRDGTGTMQCVAFEKDVAPEAFEAIGSLTQESAVVLTGALRADARAPGGIELGIEGIDVVSLAEPDYPIQPKEHGTGFLMDQRHLWIRSPRQVAILRIRATIIRAIRGWLDGEGFVGVDTPILTPSACEGTSTLFATDYFGKPAFLAQSGQLYNEAAAAALGKVYCFGPTFRAEKSKTRRHLTEFWMVEPEIAFADLEDIMDIEERFVSHIVQTVLAEHRTLLTDVLERDVSALERIVAPFPRLSYDDAVAKLQAGPFPDFPWGEDFGAPHETFLAEQSDRPLFVYHYPTAVKAFYMETVADRPEVCRSVDLLAPEGYGEIIGGGQRTTSVALLEQRIVEHGLNRDDYLWYLDLRRYGSVPHSGFGLGVERTVAWICNLGHVRETTAFPRMLDTIYP